MRRTPNANQYGNDSRNDDLRLSSEQISAILKSALQKICWHVSVGGCTLPTFSLALGEKFKRGRVLRNPAQPAVFREYEPEVSLFVWCAWRLDCGDLVLASDDGSATEITSSLKRLVGKPVAGIEVSSPAWDLVMHFDESLNLRVFCNRSGKSRRFSSNWQAKVRQTRIVVGPGEKLSLAHLA